MPSTVDHLAKHWRQGRAQKPATRVFKLQNNSPAFTSKSDQVQTHLQTLASMDDLLSGRKKLFTTVVKCCLYSIVYMEINFCGIKFSPNPAISVHSEEIIFPYKLKVTISSMQSLTAYKKLA